MNDQANQLLLTQIVTGLTTLVTLIFSLMERRRNHVRQIESELYREKLSADIELAKNTTVEVAKKVAEEVKSAVVQNKETRATEIKDLGKTVTDAIDKNTDMNREALDAANCVNEKIQSLGMEIAEQKGAARMEAKLEAIEAKVVTIETENVEIHAEKSKPAKPALKKSNLNK